MGMACGTDSTFTSVVCLLLRAVADAVGIHVDELLPVLVHTATHALGRSRKIAACEALHSMVTFLIGAHNVRESNCGGFYRGVRY